MVVAEGLFDRAFVERWMRAFARRDGRAGPLEIGVAAVEFRLEE